MKRHERHRTLVSAVVCAEEPLLRENASGHEGRHPERAGMVDPEGAEQLACEPEPSIAEPIIDLDDIDLGGLGAPDDAVMTGAMVWIKPLASL